MASAQDYLSAIQNIDPTVTVDDGLMTELNRRAGEGATVDQVVNDAFNSNGGYSQVQSGIQNSLNPAYQTQQDTLNNTLSGAQATAAQQSQAANDANSRLVQQLQYTYGQNLQNNALSRQGIVSGASNNYNTDQQATSLTNANQSLQDALNGISTTLAGTQQQVTSGLNDLNTQHTADLTNATNSVKNRLILAGSTPYGTVATDSNGQQLVGTNQSTGLLGLLNNNSAALTKLASTPSLLPVLQQILTPYLPPGTTINDDTNDPSASTTQTQTQQPTTQTQTQQPVATAPPAQSNPALNNAQQEIIKDLPNVYATAAAQKPGMISREQLITKLVNEYGSTVQPKDIANLVYGLVQSPTERLNDGGTFKGVSSSWTYQPAPSGPITTKGL